MTTSPIAGDSQIANALTTLGTTALGSTRNELLTQLIVAAANATGGGGTAGLLLAGGGSSTLAALTSSTPANAGFTYLVQGGQDRKLFMTAAGVSMVEATDAAAQAALLTGLLAKAGGTMTGQLVNSTNGAASTPSLLLSGTPFTGGSTTTTKPLVNIETAGATSTGWSTGGTMLGVNSPSGFAGRQLDVKSNGASQVWTDPNTLDGIWVKGYVSAEGSLALTPYSGSGGSYLTAAINFGSVGAIRATIYDSHAYIWSDYQVLLAGTRADPADCGVKWGAAGVVKITNGSTGRGTIDAAGYQVGGVAGANFSGVATNITVVNGLITAIS